MIFHFSYKNPILRAKYLPPPPPPPPPFCTSTFAPLKFKSYKEIQLFSISLGLAHFQALLTVSTPATALNICNTEMYNGNLSKSWINVHLLYNVQSYV